MPKHLVSGTDVLEQSAGLKPLEFTRMDCGCTCVHSCSDEMSISVLTVEKKGVICPEGSHVPGAVVRFNSQGDQQYPIVRYSFCDMEPADCGCVFVYMHNLELEVMITIIGARGLYCIDESHCEGGVYSYDDLSVTERLDLN